VGDVIPLIKKGTALEVLYEAAQEVSEDSQYDRAVVILQSSEEGADVYALISDNCNPIDAFWALHKVASWQLEDDDE
jgi:hypothetical protein